MNFKQYKRTAIAEMRPVSLEELRFGPQDDNISVSAADEANGSPLEGDMIARNPKNHNDQWLVAKQYFEDNFEEIS